MPEQGGFESLHVARNALMMQQDLKENVLQSKTFKKSRTFIVRDARYTVQDIARMVGIFVVSAFPILKKNLKVRHLNASWIPFFYTLFTRR